MGGSDLQLSPFANGSSGDQAQSDLQMVLSQDMDQNGFDLLNLESFDLGNDVWGSVGLSADDKL